MSLHPAGNVISQVIDGEAIVINLADGCYYTFNKPGSDVWACVESGADAEQAACHLAGRYDLGFTAATEVVTDFVRELLAEGLAFVDGAPGAAARSDPTPAGPFERPSLRRFEDMRDLILLDPVHEVDEQQGWPHPRPASFVNDGIA